jgi:hypothetical protein
LLTLYDERLEITP